MTSILLRNNYKFQKTIKLPVTQACIEFYALDRRAFEVTKYSGFQNLAKALFDPDRFTYKLSIQTKDLLPRSTTVNIIKYPSKLIILFDLTFFLCSSRSMDRSLYRLEHEILYLLIRYLRII
jgi:hypothetical protein